MAGPTSMPTPKPSAGTPSQDANVSAETLAAAGSAPYGSGTKVGLDGRPVGSPITVGIEQKYVGSSLQTTVVPKKTQYTSASAMESFAALGNQEKANLLAKLAQIPGIYAKGSAPTQQMIIAMAQSGAVVPRKQDVDALTKVMTYSDRVGEDYVTSVNKFFYNKNLAAQYFSVPSAGPSVTPSDALISELNANFMDLFNAAPDKKTAAAYAKEVQRLEAKQGSISAQQREDIRLKYIQSVANQRFKTVKGTTDTKDDALLQEGALGAVVQQIRAAYTNNGIPINDSEVYKKAIQGVRSEQALQNVLNVTKQQAKALYPAFKDLIDQGAEVADLVSPYASVYSQIYGKPVAQLKPADFYEVAAGDKPISPAEYKKMLYAKPEFKDTDTYKNTKQNALTAIVRAFGIGPA